MKIIVLKAFISLKTFISLTILISLSGCIYTKPLKKPLPMPKMESITSKSYCVGWDDLVGVCDLSVKEGKLSCDNIRKFKCTPPKLFNCFDEKSWPKFLTYFEYLYNRGGLDD